VFALENDSVCLTNPDNGEVHRFGFDYIYGPDSLQTDLWNSVVSTCCTWLKVDGALVLLSMVVYQQRMCRGTLSRVIDGIL
jgi:hypothetical protein